MTESSGGPGVGGLSADLIGVGIDALVNNAKRLGLTWTLRMATVVSVQTGVTSSSVTTPGNVIATYDGDSEPISMTNMTGVGLVVGMRVYVIIIPPSGNFIVGYAGNAPYRNYQILTTTTASVTFDNIPRSVASLTLKWRARIDAAVNLQFLGARYNGDSSAVYTWHYMQGLNATASAAPFSAQTYAMLGFVTGASAPTNVFASGIAQFIGWDTTLNPNFNHQSGALGSGVANFATTVGGGVMAATGDWTSLQIIPASGSFVTGSSFELVGEVT